MEGVLCWVGLWIAIEVEDATLSYAKPDDAWRGALAMAFRGLLASAPETIFRLRMHLKHPWILPMSFTANILIGISNC
jgi:hypothetical protein